RHDPIAAIQSAGIRRRRSRRARGRSRARLPPADGPSAGGIGFFRNVSRASPVSRSRTPNLLSCSRTHDRDRPGSASFSGCRKDAGRMTDNPTLSPERQPEDQDAALRPKSLGEFVGQEAARENLRVFIEAARGRGEAMDHVLFFGPPGLGKTTLAQIVAKEMGVGFRGTSGPVIGRAGVLAALLTNLEPHDVLFIDEIHRLNPVVEEVLYPAMEDRALDLIIGEGPSARSVRIDLPPFTLIGATTRQGLLTTPLRDRFGIPVRLNFYTVPELERVVTRGARLLGAGIDAGGAQEIARRSRGTPRVAGRLLRR